MSAATAPTSSSCQISPEIKARAFRAMSDPRPLRRRHNKSKSKGSINGWTKIQWKIRSSTNICGNHHTKISESKGRREGEISWNREESFTVSVALMQIASRADPAPDKGGLV